MMGIAGSQPGVRCAQMHNCCHFGVLVWMHTPHVFTQQKQSMLLRPLTQCAMLSKHQYQYTFGMSSLETDLVSAKLGKQAALVVQFSALTSDCRQPSKSQIIFRVETFKLHRLVQIVSGDARSKCWG